MVAKQTYLYIILFIACLAPSCTSEIPDNVETGRGSEMSFAVSDGSRASDATAFDKFAVYGDMFSNKIDLSVIFNKMEVVKNGNDWCYEGTQYWLPGFEYSFVAITPLSVLETDNNIQYSNSQFSFAYALPDDYTQTSDILAATHRRKYTSGATDAVCLQFGHLFSLINFSVELTEPSTRSEECFKIHKLEMTGFGTSATINVEPASLQSTTQTNDSKIDIVTAKGNGSLTVSFDEPIEVINGAAAVKMFGGNNAIIMLPQALEGNDKVQISLTYTANDEAEETQVSANLSNFKWERGRSYNYNIKLELEQKEVNMVISQAIIVPWNLVDDHDEVDAR